MNINDYIRPDAFILIPVLYIIGVFLRQTPCIPLWCHAWIKLLFAVISCLLYYGFEIQSVVQGILVTGAAVMSRDLIVSTMNRFNPEKGTQSKDDKEKGDKEKD
ncbi:holin [Bacillus sp. V3B]|uniref:phage holin family protein n=1 Tax=Bacillus sp. V3B TaxID=2804915 RepID=UPI00210EAB12|nr:phage holin family protein [Bacillus sp. V3B]MCQ6277091.1 holin [Bacillus sp. V3B]